MGYNIVDDNMGLSSFV